MYVQVGKFFNVATFYYFFAFWFGQNGSLNYFISKMNEDRQRERKTDRHIEEKQRYILIETKRQIDRESKIKRQRETESDKGIENGKTLSDTQKEKKKQSRKRYN